MFDSRFKEGKIVAIEEFVPQSNSSWEKAVLIKLPS